MSMYNEVVQNRGYFDSNTYYPTADAFKTSVTTTGGTTNITLAAGQIIGGTHTSISAPHTLAVRYSTSGTDGIINCVGGTNTPPPPYHKYFFFHTAPDPNPLQTSRARPT